MAQSPIVTGSRFSGLDPDGYADVHVASTWEFASDAGFTNILHTSGRDTVNLFSYDLSEAGYSFDGGVTVYVRVSYEGASGNVAASAAVSFETVAIPTNDAAGTAFGGGYFASRMVDETGAPYALVTAPKAEGEASGTMTWQQATDWCAGLTIGGHSDWQLATLDERIAEYRALKPTTDSNNTSYGDSSLIDPPTSNYTARNPSQTSIAAFREGGAEAFIANNYWSATEYSSSSAYRVLFNSGIEYSSNKTNSYYVRAVRRVYY